MRIDRTAACLLLLFFQSAFMPNMYAQKKQSVQSGNKFFPPNNSRDVNPDTHLEITFPSVPAPGKGGEIRVYDAADNRLVDKLDLSIPPGPVETTPSPDAIYTPVPYEYAKGHFTNANTKPGTPSGKAMPASGNYQLTIIGGFTDGFHFYPVIIRDRKAVIYLHNNLLEYGKTYYVQIDNGALNLKDNSFKGISGKNRWRFTTKKNPPTANTDKLVVSADGSGDFNTVQGAMDFIRDDNEKPVTVFIKSGLYEEIVYARCKKNITLMGEDREKVIVQYANNEIFNPHPVNIKTNEMPGTFPSRRAAFALDNCSKVNLINMTIKTTAFGQAEGLLVNGSEIIVSNVTIIGSGDALQSNGTAYYGNCLIEGDGDTIFGRGAAFFSECEIVSDGPFMWVRNTKDNHGNVFVNCKFRSKGERENELARAPNNKGKLYPYCEAVLISCTLSGISPAGWGPVGGETSNIHYWEFNSRDKEGKPVDVSGRFTGSHQLTIEKDTEIISNYMKPSYVLGGWEPVFNPVIFEQPQPIEVKEKDTAEFVVKAAAVPKAEYQWLRNGIIIRGAVSSIYKIENVQKGYADNYSVRIKSGSNIITSNKAALKVK